MPETESSLMTDEQILNIDDGAGSAIESEPSAPTESTDQELPPTGQVPPPDELAEKPDALPAKPQQGEKPEDKAKLGKPEGQEQLQESFGQIFPGGMPQAKEALEKAQQLDAVDAIFTGGSANYPQMYSALGAMFEKNPAALGEAIMLGRQYLEKNAPQELAQIDSLVIGEELQEAGLWDFFEDKFAKATTQEEQMAWNDLAAWMQQRYGLHAVTPESQTAMFNEFRTDADAVMTDFVENSLRRAMPAGFESIPPQLQAELLKAGHIAVQDSIRRDERLGQAIRDALGKGISKKTGIKVVQIMAERAGRLAPLVASELAKQYADLFKVTPAPKPASRPKAAPTQPPLRSMAEAMSKRMSMREILKATQSPEEQAESNNLLGKAEANRMSERDVLDSKRTADLTPPEKKARKVSRSDILKSRLPFSAILDDALEVEG